MLTAVQHCVRLLNNADMKGHLFLLARPRKIPLGKSITGLRLRTAQVIALLVGITLTPALRAELQKFVIGTTHSFATFEVSHIGISPPRGRFGNAAGTATIDDTQGTGTLDITLDARSLSTGNELLEKLLKGDSGFNTE